MALLPKLSVPKRLLIVAPHPDDVHLAGGLVVRVLGNGGKIRVVNLTCGDFVDGWISGSIRYARKIGFQRHAQPAINYGFLRYEEDQKAMRALGASATDACYLGYPDGGLEAMRSGANPNSSAQPWKNPVTGCDQVPYPFARTPGAPYTWASLVGELAQEIADFKPDCIVVSHPNDHHSDHAASWWATAEATSSLGARLGEAPRILTALDAHSARFKTRFDPQVRFSISRATPSPTRWEEFELTPAEVDAKARCLHCYTSQMVWEHPFRSSPPFGKSYLFGYVGANELYGEVLSVVEDEKFQKQVARAAFLDRVLGVIRNTLG